MNTPGRLSPHSRPTRSWCAALGLLIGLISAEVLADPDPAQACRQAHADDPTAHIACLENALESALRNTSNTAGDKAQTTPEAASVLGSEQVQQKQRASGEITEQALTVRVISARYNSAGLGVFTLDNGQVWRETQPSPQQLRLDAGETRAATIERGTVGGYRMEIDGIRRMLKIERLK